MCRPKYTLGMTSVPVWARKWFGPGRVSWTGPVWQLYSSMCFGRLPGVRWQPPTIQNLEVKNHSHMGFFNSQPLAEINMMGMPVQSSFHSTNRCRMSEALTTWAVMQALMNVNVTIKAKVLLAFRTRYTRSWHVSCINIGRPKLGMREIMASPSNRSIRKLQEFGADQFWIVLVVRELLKQE